MKRNILFRTLMYAGIGLALCINAGCFSQKSGQAATEGEHKNSSASIREETSRLESIKPASLDIMIGQMIMVGFKGTTPPGGTSNGSRWFQVLDSQICNGQVGGVLILEYNIKNRQQILNLTNYFNSVNSPYPLFIAVDQEGGAVQRLSVDKGFSWYPSAKETAAGSEEEALVLYKIMASELSYYGINMNLGPVVDLELDPSSPAIGVLGRSFSPEPPVVISFARQFINAHRQYNVITVLKHFPGHGSAADDSHRGLTDVTKLWKEEELIPYEALMSSSHVDAVMTAHVFNANVDPEKPASLSPGHIKEVLRDRMQFQGLVITDDLQMKAVSNYYTFEERVIMAVQAGSDILLFANSFTPDVKIPVKAAQVIKKAVEEGVISEKRILQSYRRIRMAKKRRHSLARMPSGM